jgi:hypothetical protein
MKESAFQLQDMVSPINKKNIFILLFLVHFLSYAMSPLSYRFTGHHTSQNIYLSEKAPLLAKNIHIFLWELICAKFSAAKDDSNTHSTFRILIKKARAIIPQNTFAKLTPSVESAITIDICLFLLLLSISPLQKRYDSQTRKGFSPFYGDRSPPYR